MLRKIGVFRKADATESWYSACTGDMCDAFLQRDGRKGWIIRCLLHSAPPDTDTALSCLPCRPSVADTVIYNATIHPRTRARLAVFCFFFSSRNINVLTPLLEGQKKKTPPLRVYTDGLREWLFSSVQGTRSIIFSHFLKKIYSFYLFCSTLLNNSIEVNLFCSIRRECTHATRNSRYSRKYLWKRTSSWGKIL